MLPSPKLLLTLALCGAFAAAGESRWLEARALPSDDTRASVREVLIVPPEARDERLAAAHHAYTVWSQQMLAAVNSPERTEAWRQFLGMDVSLGQAYQQMGDAAYNEQNFREAAELFSIAFDYLPEDFELQKKLAFALKESGRYERSIALLRDIILQAGSDPQIWLWLADAERLVGDYEASANSYRTARDLAPPEEVESYDAYIGYTERLVSPEVSWLHFETHRDFAKRQGALGRSRRFVGEYLESLLVAPDTVDEDEEENQADFRRGWVHLEIAERLSFIKDHPLAYDHYVSGIDYYRAGDSPADIMRGLGALAALCEQQAHLHPRSREAWFQQAAEYWQAANDEARDHDDVEYLRFTRGSLLRAYAETRPMDDPDLVEARREAGLEVPWSGKVNEFSVASAVLGELTCRIKEGDLGGSRLLIEMSEEFFGGTGFLIDIEQRARMLAELAGVYFAQEHYVKANEIAVQGLQQMEDLLEYIDLDAYHRSRNPDTFRDLTAIAMASMIADDQPVEALNFAEAYQVVGRRYLLGSRIADEAWRNDFNSELDYIAARVPVLQEKLNEANAARDTFEAARLDDLLKRLDARFSILGHADRLTPFNELSYADIERRVSEELVTSVPEGAAVLHLHCGPQTGAALWVTGGTAAGAVLPEATNRALEALVIQWVDGDSAGRQAAYDEAHRILIEPIAEQLPEVTTFYVAADEMITHLPVSALLSRSVSDSARVSRVPGVAYIEFLQHFDRETPDALVPSEALNQEAMQELLRQGGAYLVEAEADLRDSAPTMGLLRFSDDPHGVALIGETLAWDATAALAAFNLDIETSRTGWPSEHLDALVESMAHAGTPAVVVNRGPVSEAARTAFFEAFGASLGDGAAAALRAGQEAARAAAPDTLDWTAFEYHGLAW